MYLSTVLSILVFLAGMVVFSPSAWAQAKAPDEVVATVGAKNITLTEFNKKYSEVRAQSINPPTKAQFLEDLVRFEIGVQEAEKRNLKDDPTVHERLRQELYKGLLEKELGAKIQTIKIAEADMKAWYATNPEIKTSHILVEFKPESTPEQIAAAKKRATEIYEEVKASKRSFEELVKLYTDDPLSKQTGGDVGWQGRNTLVPNYYQTAINMKLNEVKGLIETQFGFHIIKLTGKRTYEDANKRQIRAGVFDDKRKALFNEYFDKLKKNYATKVNSNLIK